MGRARDRDVFWLPLLLPVDWQTEDLKETQSSEMGKKIKKDEKPPPDDVFDTLLVESRQAATVVLMLTSPEEDVQSKACQAIYKFVEKCDENKKQMLDLDAIDPL